MTDTYDKINRWYGWNGGECPVHAKTEIEVMLADGEKMTARPAGYFTWDNVPDPVRNIIAFRITKLYVEPRKARQWWINERMDGYLTVHKSVEESRGASGQTIHVREVLPEQDDVD